MSWRHVEIVIAVSLVLFSIDIVIPFIDILAIPVPRYIGGFSFSLGFALVALAFLVPMARRVDVCLISHVEAAFLCILVFWIGIEGFIASTGGVGSVDLVLSMLPAVVMAVSARIYLSIFKDHVLLVKVFILTSAWLVVVHSILLIFMRFDIFVPYVNTSEVFQRNGLAVLLPVGLWMLSKLTVPPWPVFGRVYSGLLMLSLLHTWLNHSRGSLLIIVWVLFVALAERKPNFNRWLTGGLKYLGVGIVLAALFAHPVQSNIGGWGGLQGVGDDATSVQVRGLTNYLLLKKLSDDPVLGLGWAEVSDTRSNGYMSHTLYLIIASSYGLAGLLPLLFLIGNWLRRQEYARKALPTHFLFLVVLISSLFNDAFIYAGMIAALVNHSLLRKLGQ